MNLVQKFNKVLQQLKESFVGKNEIIDLLGLCLIAKENAFLLGPPGTAKSAIVKKFSSLITDGKNFEYLLTRFTEPNEIFGPFDIRKLKEGDLVTNTEGMMPEASLIFLDEIFNANSAILNSLLMALNERIFRRGRETHQLPALMFVGASNQLPEDEALHALLDRFLIRVKCDYVEPDLLFEVLVSGWKMENEISESKEITISVSEIAQLQTECRKVDLTFVRNAFVNIIHALRNSGFAISDRRAVKLQNLIAASALMCGRNKAILSDLWVLKYTWDVEEQIEILESIVNNVISEEPVSEQMHKQARINKTPDAEELMKEVQILATKWGSGMLSYEEQSVVKDKLRFLQSRADWIQHGEQKEYLTNAIDDLWKQILQTIA